MIKVRILFKGEEALDADFAFPPSVGTKFVVGGDRGGRYLCEVTNVVHFPVNSGSGNTPMVGVYATKKLARSGWRGWLDSIDVEAIFNGLVKKT